MAIRYIMAPSIKLSTYSPSSSDDHHRIKAKKPCSHHAKNPIVLRRAEQLPSVKLLMLTDRYNLTQQTMGE